MGYKLGINGVVSFKNAHIKETIKEYGIVSREVAEEMVIGAVSKSKITI